MWAPNPSMPSSIDSVQHPTRPLRGGRFCALPPFRRHWRHGRSPSPDAPLRRADLPLPAPSGASHADNASSTAHPSLLSCAIPERSNRCRPHLYLRRGALGRRNVNTWPGGGRSTFPRTCALDCDKYPCNVLLLCVDHSLLRHSIQLNVRSCRAVLVETLTRQAELINASEQCSCTRSHVRPGGPTIRGEGNWDTLVLARVLEGNRVDARLRPQGWRG